MEWLNYHHLLYFWTVVREGSVSAAARRLRLAQPTISGQIRALEERFGEKLFARQGRRLALTDIGRIVYGYADEIFGLGRELLDTLKDRPTGRPLRFQVGVADRISKAIAYRLLEPALRLSTGVYMMCREGRPDYLVAELAMHHLDLVIADTPSPSTVKVKAFSHLLGASGITMFAAPALAGFKSGFPKSLNGAPLLLPSESTTLRRLVDGWMDRHKVRPRIVAEFDDSALLEAFGRAGAGLFVAPSALEADLTREGGAVVVGRIDGVKERYYAISIERKLVHPAVVAISEAAPRVLKRKA
jgi:LysR family transcriptional regulator, transcriptional activator of nhaA